MAAFILGLIIISWVIAIIFVSVFSARRLQNPGIRVFQGHVSTPNDRS